jgi:L-2,4-diaminobutyric acid acetyltransferase
MTDISFQSPTLAHVKEITRLVDGTDHLDRNSDYAYALWCTDFAANSAVAIRDDKVIAFLTGYRRPTAPDTYFLWQTAAEPRHGVPNLGLKLILYAVDREIGKGARAVEASVDETNTSIVILMKSLKRRLGGELFKSVLFSSEMLSTDKDEHHDEILYRVEF